MTQAALHIAYGVTGPCLFVSDAALVGQDMREQRSCCETGAAVTCFLHDGHACVFFCMYVAYRLVAISIAVMQHWAVRTFTDVCCYRQYLSHLPNLTQAVLHNFKDLVKNALGCTSERVATLVNAHETGCPI